MKPCTLWLFIIILFLTACVSCSKNTSPDTEDPGSGNNCCDTTGNKSDTTGTGSGSGSGNGGGSGSGGNGSNNSNGVTLMRGTGGTALFYNFLDNGRLTHWLSQDGFSSLLRLAFDTAAPIRVKLVNAERGTMTAVKKINDFGYTGYEIDFSNRNFYTHTDQVAKPDTAGKVQLWVYREDGQNIMSASGGHPAVKAVILIPGKFPTDIDGLGVIHLIDYDFAGYSIHPPAITSLESLQAIFSNARWKVNRFTWPW